MAQENTARALDPTDATSPGTDSVPSARDGGHVAAVEPSAGTLTPATEGAPASLSDLALLGDISVSLSMEIGRTTITIAELLNLGKGSVVELQRMADEPLDILVNGTLVAHGEAVVVGERFGIRLTDVVSQRERLARLA